MPSLQTFRSRLPGISGTALVAILSASLAAPGQGSLLAQEAQAASGNEQETKLSTDQLDSLVAPIALYPDPLLAQCLVASTYPIDIVAAQQWLAKNSSLKGEELTKAAEQQPWDPSVQALVTLPDALKVLSENIKWTADLGDAFLAQETDVMDAVQRMRAKAKDGGKLASSEQQKVETKTVESKTVIEIQPTSTEVVYVPSYSPSVIWGPVMYPYPPMYYPPYYGGALTRLRRRDGHRNRNLGGLGLGLRMARRRQHHQHQQQQQLRQPLQQAEQHQPQREQQLAAQRPAARRGSLQGPRHGEQVRRRRPRRLGRPASRRRGHRQGQSMDRGGSGSRGAGASSMDRGGSGSRVPDGRPRRVVELARRKRLQRRRTRVLQRKPCPVVELARLVEHERHVPRRRIAGRRRAAALAARTHDEQEIVSAHRNVSAHRGRRLSLSAASPALPARAADKPAAQRTFDTPQQAADALIQAAAAGDIPALLAILGPEGKPIVSSGDPVEDKNDLTKFAEKAHEKMEVSFDVADPEAGDPHRRER